LGAPKRNRSKFEKPKERWNLERIKTDNAFKDEYGLKNMKELWMVQTEVSRIRRNVRELLSGSAGSENMRDRMLNRLKKLGLATNDTTLDSLLDLKENDLLNRRLQTVVFKKGMARTVRQARQLTVHGFIAIDGRKVNRPGYLVDLDAEKKITYYKPIDIAPQRKELAEKAQENAVMDVPQAPDNGKPDEAAKGKEEKGE
jgi:small subunit ribosomal protein S4